MKGRHFLPSYRSAKSRCKALIKSQASHSSPATTYKIGVLPIPPKPLLLLASNPARLPESRLRHKMRASILALALLTSTSIPVITAQTTSLLSNVTTPNLNLTTIVARDGRSILQCWSISGFMQSATAGTAGALNLFLGETTNASYTVIPPRFNGGLHTAPAPQCVIKSTTRLPD